MRLPVITGFLVLALAGCRSSRQPVGELAGTAENLWSQKINLADLNHGTGIIHPFSPAT